jgi:uncharacterized protein (TIGR00369 family)
MTPTDFTPRDPDFAARVERSFRAQAFMSLLGARLVKVDPGAVDIALDFRDDLTQQHGYLHAAALAAIADSACGYAALSLLPPAHEVLSVEFKLNLLRPGVGERFLAEGRVIRSGKLLSVASADVRAATPGGSSLVATMLATLIAREKG